MVFEAIIAFLMAYVALYTLIGRICQCVEHCATAKAYSKFRENGILVKMNDVEGGIKTLNGEKQDVAKMFAEK